jgi:hypothetical protein
MLRMVLLSMRAGDDTTADGLVARRTSWCQNQVVTILAKESFRTLKKFETGNGGSTSCEGNKAE